jgi:Cof subfamily protein (haloacid dehalogenase superfamily)
MECDSTEAELSERPTIRLLALDLDGTIVGGPDGITDRVQSAVRKAQDRGVEVTIATGRMFQSARRFACQLGVTAPIICYQGALIRDPGTAATLHSRVLPIAPALEVLAFAKARGLHINAYVDDELYMESITPEGRFYANTSDVPIQVTPELAEIVRRGTTKLVIVTDEDRVPSVIDALQAKFGSVLAVTRSHPRFAETIGQDVSKGEALRLVAKMLHVPIRDTMAIGDNLNDLDLVTAAGFGVAMGNGDPRVCAAADWVTTSFAEDGAAVAIERFVLGQQGPV